MSLKQKKVKFKPMIKLNHNIYIIKPLNYHTPLLSYRSLQKPQFTS